MRKQSAERTKNQNSKKDSDDSLREIDLSVLHRFVGIFFPFFFALSSSVSSLWGTVSSMDILLLSSQKMILSALNEGEVGTDSLLIPLSYWNRLDVAQRKALSKKLPFLLIRFTKYVASLDRLHGRGGKIKYNWGAGDMKKMTIHVHSGVWAVLGALAAAHGVSRCFLFNYLLWLEDVGVGDSIVDTMNRGVPQFHSVYRMIWTLDLRKNQISRALHFAPDPITSESLPDPFP